MSNNELQNEIAELSEFLTATTGTAVVEDEPIEDKPIEDKVEDKVEDKPTEDKVDDRIVEDKPTEEDLKAVDEGKVKDEKVEDKPVEDKKEDEVVKPTPLEIKDKLIESLSRQLNTQVMPAAEVQKYDKPVEDEVEEPELKPQAVGKKDILSDMSDEDVTLLMADPQRFREVANRIVTEATRIAVGDARSMAGEQVSLNSLAGDFYNGNTDLVENAEFVEYTANKLRNDNPEWDNIKVFSELGATVRESLGKPKVVKDESGNVIVDDTPALAHGSVGGVRKPVDKEISEFSQDVSDMLKDSGIALYK